MNVGSGAGHGRWRSEQMSQLLERLLPGFLQILAMLLLVGGFYLPLLLFLGGQDPLQPGVSVLRLDYLLEFLADPWNPASACIFSGTGVLECYSFNPARPSRGLAADQI